ncbi:RlmE family RNA methyltransferase [Parvibaculum sp.]|uniref:RlmE family RNA methyltransferase n=1 Tax=Parvibaculum sp. TaxID=2024848 RepID=UPI000C8AF7E3|nr:RlmE family RNA methyltransferase [Parvibaculum sp.]MAB12521.1 23S rRNA methyltransferase [Parvibaculum sp.]
MVEKKKGSGARSLKVRVKTAKRRKTSSTRWLQRQLNDPYVQAAKRDGLRSRAAYKLTEMDDKFHVLKPGQRVVDLGAAPGGWCQVAVERVKAPTGEGTKPGKAQGAVVGIDLLEVEPVPGSTILQMDFLEEGADERLIKELGGLPDVVMSDMAANTTGHKQTDHLKIMALCEAAAHFAIEVLNEDGDFIAKVFRGGTENELLAFLKQHFTVVRHVKPKASRADSSEMYVLATGFKGRGEGADEVEEA